MATIMRTTEEWTRVKRQARKSAETYNTEAAKLKYENTAAITAAAQFCFDLIETADDAIKNGGRSDDLTDYAIETIRAWSK